MELAIQVQNLDEAVWVSFHADSLWKSMTPSLLTLTMGK